MHKITTLQSKQDFEADLHWTLAGAGRGGGRGSDGSLGIQGFASKLVGTVLSSWTGLLHSHLCCGCCRSLLICTQKGTHTFHTHIFCHHSFTQSCSTEQQHQLEFKIKPNNVISLMHMSVYIQQQSKLMTRCVLEQTQTFSCLAIVATMMCIQLTYCMHSAQANRQGNSW